MKQPRRHVRRSQLFVEEAKKLFPPGGSQSGRASYELFEALLLNAIELNFALDFEGLPVGLPGVPSIRHVMTHNVPLFPPLVAYGVLLHDDTIELVSLTLDEDYWDLIADDPDD